MEINFLIKNKETINHEKSFQDWLGINTIDDFKIKLINGKEVIILKVQPINFELKSELEQKAILDQYKIFLKNINSKIQIIISSKKTDISNHLLQISKFTNDNPIFKEATNDYISLIKKLINSSGTVTKNFYIAFESTQNSDNEILKIKEYLSSCGNDVEQCSKEDIEFLIKNFINKRLLNLKA